MLCYPFVFFHTIIKGGSQQFVYGYIVEVLFPTIVAPLQTHLVHAPVVQLLGSQVRLHEACEVDRCLGTQRLQLLGVELHRWLGSRSRRVLCSWGWSVLCRMHGHGALLLLLLLLHGGPLLWRVAWWWSVPHKLRSHLLGNGWACNRLWRLGGVVQHILQVGCKCSSLRRRRCLQEHVFGSCLAHMTPHDACTHEAGSKSHQIVVLIDECQQVWPVAHGCNTRWLVSPAYSISASRRYWRPLLPGDSCRLDLTSTR